MPSPRCWRRPSGPNRDHEPGPLPTRSAPPGPQHGFRIDAFGVGAGHGGGAAVRGDIPAAWAGLGISRAAMYASRRVAQIAGWEIRLQNLRADSRREGTMAVVAA